jgi:hypothetical protein
LYRQDPPAATLEAAAVELRNQLIADLGGPDVVSTAKKLLVDVAVSHALKLQRVEAYIAKMDSLVDKRHRCTWRVVLDAAALARHLAGVLSVLGLERVPAPVESLEEYAVRMAAQKEADAALPPSTD